MRPQAQQLPTPSEVPTGPLPKFFRRWRVPFFYGWVVVAVTFLAETSSSAFGGSNIGLFYKPLQNTFGWSLSQMVGVTTANALVGIVIAPFLGALIDRVGAKTIMLWGTSVAGVGMLLMSRIEHIWQFWLLYAAISAMGLQELGGLPSTVAITKWFARRRGRAMAMSSIGGTLGGVVGPPAVGLLIVSLGWRQTWGVMGVILLVVMVPVILVFMRSRPETMGLRPDGDPSVGSEAKGGVPTSSDAGEPSWTLKEAMRTRTLWLIILAFDLTGLAVGGVLSILVPFLVKQEGMSLAGAGWVLSGFMAGATVSRLIWGFLVERISVRVCFSVILLVRGIAALSLILVPFPWNIGGYLLFSGVLGGSIGLIQPLMLGQYFGRDSFGRIQGMVRPFLALPQLVGPLLLAWMSEVTGSFTLGFAIAAVLAIVGAGVAVFATRPIRRTASPL